MLFEQQKSSLVLYVVQGSLHVVIRSVMVRSLKIYFSGKASIGFKSNGVQSTFP